MTYLRIEEITYGEPVPQDVLEGLLELELVEYRREPAQPREVVLVSERDAEALRAMLRLATVLEVNPAGVETIMHMRRRMAEMQRELRRLRRLEATLAGRGELIAKGYQTER